MDIIRVPIGFIIDLCYRLVPNYAIALLLFALIMKILLFPFGIKQQKNMVKQASLRPKEQAIRNRYAGRTDKPTQQKMQQEIMDLYQKEKYNPAGGCLPMIVQLIIVFALYAVVTNPLRYVCHIDADNIDNIGVRVVELYNNGDLKLEGVVSENMIKVVENAAEKIGEDGSLANVKSPFGKNSGLELANIIRANGVEKFYTEKDGLEMLDPDFTDDDLPDFTVFGGKFDLSRTPDFADFDWLMLIPLLTFIGTFASMKLTKKLSYQSTQTQGDAAVSMKMMDIVMPLMTTFFTFSVPAVLAVYWIYQNVLGTLQQFVLKLMYPYPTFTEAEYKAVEREMNKGIKQPKKAKKSTGKSAHRIDLDDEIEASSNDAEAVKPNKKGSSMLPPVAMKDESDKETPPEE